MRKPDYTIFEQQGADQPVHPHSLISPLVVRCLYSIPILALCQIPGLKLPSVTERPGLSLTWSQTSEERFSRDVAHLEIHLKFTPEAITVLIIFIIKLWICVSFSSCFGGFN